MNKEEMLELKSVVRRTMEEQMEMYTEVWLTADRCSNTFPSLTKSWLKRYGHSIQGRRQVTVTDEKGEKHASGWLYPMHKIQRMFATGEIEQLKCRAIVVPT
jgi:hypothetical protein